MGKSAKKKPIKKMEKDDEIETVIGSPDDAMIDHDFLPSLENAFAAKAIVVLTLDRKTGKVNIDGTLSTPMETWAMLGRAIETAAEVAELPLHRDDEY